MWNVVLIKRNDFSQRPNARILNVTGMHIASTQDRVKKKSREQKLNYLIMTSITFCNLILKMFGVSWIQNQKKNAGPSIQSEDGTILNPLETAKAFNSFFGSVFPDEMPWNDVNTPMTTVTTHMNSFAITSEGVASAIDRLPINSSPGPERISTKMLKLTKYVSSVLLGALYQQSLSTGSLPDDWKLAHVVPIFKSGNRNSLTNYRSILLTCASCKLLEHIIYSQTMNHLATNNILFHNQHGFQRGHSCELQLFELVTDLHQSIQSSAGTDAIFIDFPKAFDRVPHKRLIKKLIEVKI